MKEKSVIVYSGDSALGRYLVEECRKNARLIDRCTPGADVLILNCPDEGFSPDDAVAAVRAAVPGSVVAISSWEVYPEGVDEVIFENSRVSPDTGRGEMYLQLERSVSRQCREMKIPLAIIRPAMLFGSGIGGEAAAMFSAVSRARFYTVRGCDAPRSAVCAIDVAKVALRLAGYGGVFNVCDGKRHTLRSIADAMSANTGECKRTPVLPPKSARLLAAVADRLGGKKGIWGSRELRRRMTGRCLDTTLLCETLPGLEMFDTVEVIARTAKDYPYQD